MRIVHVTDGFEPRIGGIESQVRDLAGRQAADGHHVEIVTSVASPSRDDDLLTVHRPAYVGGKPGRIGWHTSPGVTRILERNFDVVHAHVSIASPLAIAAVRRCQLAAIPVAATVHSIWPQPFARLIAAVTSAPGRPAVAWSAVSGAAAAPIRAVEAFPVRVIANGIDSQWWQQAPGNDTTADPDRFALMSTMRLARRKRPLPLLRILRAVEDRTRAGGTSVALTIAGDGPLRRSISRRIDRTASRSVTLAGYLSPFALREHMSRHDLYVAPSRLESFGIAALEARCAGLPVVAYRTSGVADFITDGVDGHLVSSDDEMAEVLAMTAGDRAHLANLRDGVRRHSPRMSWRRTVDGYDALYAQARGHADATTTHSPRREPVR